MQKGSPREAGQILIFLLVGILILAAVGGTLIYTNYSNNRSKTVPNPVVTQTPQPTPSPSDARPTPIGAGETANWKTYTDQTFKYEFKYPATWGLTPSDAKVNLSNYIVSFYPDGFTGVPSRGIDIRLATGGASLDDLSKTPSDQAAWFSSDKSTFGQIGPYKSLTKLQIYKPNPPSGFIGEWCNCIHKNVYIDLNNGKVLNINGYWSNQDNQFGNIFNQILSTFKFD